jgi:multiple sugar transport system substrate-binding protein
LVQAGGDHRQPEPKSHLRVRERWVKLSAITITLQTGNKTMNFRPHAARWTALLCFGMLVGMSLASCQTTEEPWATTVATPGGATPTAEVVAADTLVPTITPTATATAIPTLDPKFRGQTISFWHPWQGELARQVDAAVAEFNSSNEWKLTVKARPFYSVGALDEAVALGLQDKSQALPDVIAGTSEQLAAWSAAQGGVIPLDPYINHAQFGLSADEIKAYNPVFWGQDQAGENRLGLPALRTARVIFYNETWAKELGFNAAPKSPDEFKAQACAAAKKNNTAKVLEMYGTGGWLIDNDALTTLSWLGAFGAQVIPTEAGKPYTFDGAESQKAVVFLRGMLNDGCAWLASTPAPYEYFAQRKALFYTGTLPDLYAQQRWQEKSKSKDAWRVLPFPGADGKPLIYSSGYSYAIMASKPETELAAWLFLRWMEKPGTAAKLIQALPSLPVSSGVETALNPNKNTFPWNMILPLTGTARAAPALASWLEVHRLVEDASWQIYHGTTEGLAQILPALDQAIKEMGGGQP